MTMPLRHLSAVPSLPAKPVASPTRGLASPPAFKLSSRLATPSTELHAASSTPASSSKWLKDKDKDKEEEAPPATRATTTAAITATTATAATTTTNTTTTTTTTTTNTTISSPPPVVGIKECRKSVLNMDIRPGDTEAMRRQQEEKREALRQLRRQRGGEEARPAAAPPEHAQALPGRHRRQPRAPWSS
ncbi:ELMO domain-containing protein C-like [Scylla paramamosain]|uniref:ELMO domain-containing protein C-like n=1 Tax=Scylla paramamosain TaxID=85552 RepID=UPI003082A307